MHSLSPICLSSISFSCYIKNFHKISNIIPKIDKTINSINFI